MELSEILNNINNIAKDNNINKIYMVGGMPRDYSMGLSDIRTTDVDLTTNSPDSIRLGILTADFFNKNFRLFEKGNIKVMFEEYSMDFSSNFVSENVINFFKSKTCDEYKCPAFPELKDSLMEVYSRDFTINTLHQDIGTLEIIDYLDRGIKDLEDKILRTPVPADITLSDDPRRIYRAVYFSSKYGLEIDKDIIEFVLKNKDIVSEEPITDTFITSKISQAMKFNPENTIKYLDKMGILGNTPLVGEFKDYIIKNKLMIKYLDDEQNYRNLK
tara:strand:- start:595 stop:1413 length:819 start_codon:yes stop_codon:yes gene_type:complete